MDPLSSHRDSLLLPKVRFKPFQQLFKIRTQQPHHITQPRSTGKHAHLSCRSTLNAKAAAAPDGKQADEACGGNAVVEEGKNYSVMRRAWLIASAGTTLGVGAGELLMLLAPHHIALASLSHSPHHSMLPSVCLLIYRRSACRQCACRGGKPGSFPAPMALLRSQEVQCQPSQGLQALKDPAVNRYGSESSSSRACACAILS